MKSAKHNSKNLSKGEKVMEEEIRELKEEVEILKIKIADIKANYLTVDHFRQTLGLNENIDFTKNPCLHQ